MGISKQTSSGFGIERPLARAMRVNSAAAKVRLVPGAGAKPMVCVAGTAVKRVSASARSRPRMRSLWIGTQAPKAPRERVSSKSRMIFISMLLLQIVDLLVHFVGRFHHFGIRFIRA